MHALPPPCAGCSQPWTLEQHMLSCRVAQAAKPAPQTAMAMPGSAVVWERTTSVPHATPCRSSPGLTASMDSGQGTLPDGTSVKLQPRINVCLDSAMPICLVLVSDVRINIGAEEGWRRGGRGQVDTHTS